VSTVLWRCWNAGCWTSRAGRPGPSSETDRVRIHELEAAGRDAAETLARAADAIRDALAEQEAR
jgi:hypothetical protein